VPAEPVSELRSPAKGSVILVGGAIVLGMVVWLVVSLATGLLLGRTARLGNRVAKVPTNGEKPQTGGATAVVDLDAFRANRAAATPRTG
jgi:hypothetical protein